MIPFYLEDYIRKVGNPRHAGWPSDDLKEIDNISLKQLLENLGASDGAIDIIAASQLGILGFGLDSISAMDGVVTEAIAPSTINYEIAGGNDLLASALKKKVKKQFKKQSTVLRIEQNETSVTVTYQTKEGIETITADRCICTLPFPVLKNIEVAPAFSEEKQRAINELKLTPVTRTYQQFRTRVWEIDRLSGYGITDLDIQNTYSPTTTQTGRRGILVSYTGGQRALDMSAMSEKDRQNFVLRKMGSLFQQSECSVRIGNQLRLARRLAGAGRIHLLRAGTDGDASPSGPATRRPHTLRGRAYFRLAWMDERRVGIRQSRSR